MPENLVIPLFIMAAGLVLLAVGLFRRGQAQSFGETPCRPIASLAAGERQFISGKTEPRFAADAPVSKVPCVFYHYTVEKKEGHSSRRGASAHWVQVSSVAYGVFFVADATGSALVAPAGWNLDLRRPETVESDDIPLVGGMPEATRKTERIIAQDENVTILGIPRPLSEFMKYLRQNAGGVPADLVTELIKLEKEAGPSLPCFFGDGLERVADQQYGDYVAGAQNSAAFLIKTGASLTAAGVAALLYASNIFTGRPLE